MLDKIKAEPALAISAAVAVMTLLAAFGVQLTTDQQTAIQGAIGAVLVLLGGAATRAQVAPVRDAPDQREFSEDGTPYPGADDDNPAPAGDGL